MTLASNHILILLKRELERLDKLLLSRQLTWNLSSHHPSLSRSDGALTWQYQGSNQLRVHAGDDPTVASIGWLPADITTATVIYWSWVKDPTCLPFFHAVLNEFAGFSVKNYNTIEGPDGYEFAVIASERNYCLIQTSESGLRIPLSAGDGRWSYALEKYRQVLDGKQRAKRKAVADGEGPLSSPSTAEKKVKEMGTQTSDCDDEVKALPPPPPSSQPLALSQPTNSNPKLTVNYFLQAKKFLEVQADRCIQDGKNKANALQRWLDDIPRFEDDTGKLALSIGEIDDEVSGVIERYLNQARDHLKEITPGQIRRQAWKSIKKDCFKMECRKKAGQLMRMMMNAVWDGNYSSIQEAWELADALKLTKAKEVIQELEEMDKEAFPERAKTVRQAVLVAVPTSPSPEIPI